MDKVSPEKMDGLLARLIEQIKESIAAGHKLPWNEPFFVGYINTLVNPTQKTDFSGNPCPKGRPYSGMVNPLFLLYGAEDARKRNNAVKMDHRFIPRSSIITNNPAYKCAKNAMVKKGAKAIPVFFPQKFKRDNPEFDPNKPEGKNNPKEVWIVGGGFGMGYVFNVADTNLVEIGYLPELDQTEERDNPSIEMLERVICSYPQDYREAECIPPHYNMGTKAITTPPLKNAKTELAYYSTRCHELAHMLQDMVGDLKGRMDRESYSEHELEAEMCAAYVMGTLGFVTEESDEFKNSATYVQSWLEKLSNDPRMLLNAAQKAQRYGNMILKGVLPAVIKDREKFTFLPAESGNVEEEIAETA